MVYLIFGLAVFLGVHSVRIFADGWRSQTIARIGVQSWKAWYSLASVLGFALIIWGFGLARAQPVQLWSPPPAMRHVASLLTLVSFILLAGAYVPGNGLKARLHHPMVLAVKVWALAHLLANGNVAHVLLFGALLVWAALDYSAARRRDRESRAVYAPGNTTATLMAVVVGAFAWTVFAVWLHGWLIGVRPIG